MSGKSTYMRQVALIVLLAQVGSFVPAGSARIGLVDGIYTRVGALDELAQGRSTFMVEMQELSRILHAATERSLVVLDEVGRGTATYDGISIAWAATEYIHNEVRAKTLFATHYHELTALADHLDDVANVHVAAEERDGEVTFLRTVRDGATDRSYGVHVADLAGVPDPVVERSRDVLDRLREEKAVEARGSASERVQAVFDLDAGEFAALDGGDGEPGPRDSVSSGGPPGRRRERDAAGRTPVEGPAVAGAPGGLSTQKTYSRPRSSCLHDSTVAPAGARQPATLPYPSPSSETAEGRQNTIAANVKPARRTTLGSCRTADHDHFEPPRPPHLCTIPLDCRGTDGAESPTTARRARWERAAAAGGYLLTRDGDSCPAMRKPNWTVGGDRWSRPVPSPNGLLVSGVRPDRRQRTEPGGERRVRRNPLGVHHRRRRRRGAVRGRRPRRGRHRQRPRPRLRPAQRPPPLDVRRGRERGVRRRRVGTARPHGRRDSGRGQPLRPA